VIYGGKKFDIIGYNKNGNEVGVAGPNNSVTLLLDKEDALSPGILFGPPFSNEYYQSSLYSNMNDFLDYNLTSNNGIISRTLTGYSGNYGTGGYNEDNVAGPDVINQKVWPLSVDEASHLILSEKVYPDNWWSRTPGVDESAAVFGGTGGIAFTGYDVLTNPMYLRPALYLDINSPALSSVIASVAWQSNSIPIGACQAVYTNLGIDYNAETITGFDTGNWSTADAFAGLTTSSPRTTAPVDISANISTSALTLFYFKAAANTDSYFNSNTDSNGVAQESKSKLIIPARPDGPSGLSGVAPSSLGGTDGKITGTSNRMEYTQDPSLVTGLLGSGLLGASPGWTDITGGELAGLTSGTYFVRTVADQSTSKFKSFVTEVIVPAGSSPDSGPSSGKPGSGAGPSAGDRGFSSEGTAQTGIDFTGLELLVLLMLLGTVVLRRPVTGITQPEIATATPRNDG
jgi:hypothetical protein